MMATKTYQWAGSKAKHTVSEAAHKANVKTKVAAQPVVPGGTLTRGQLDASVKSAVADRYGLLEQGQQKTLGEAQQAKKDVAGPGGFYDQYLAAVAQHAKNVGDISAASNAAVGSIGPAMTGLAGQDVAALQARTNADATARGMAPAGDITNLASNALSVRQALAGSFMARQAAQNASTQGLADAQANVIAPAQKLTGANVAEGRIREARTALTGTAAQKGAYAAGQRANAITAEQKSVLATNIAAGKTAAQVAAETAKLKETTRSHKASEGLAGARIEATQAKANADAAAKGSKPNQFGVPADQWAGWSTAHRQRVIDASKGGGSGKAKAKGGTRTPQDISAGVTQIAELKRLAEAAKAGNPFRDLSPEAKKQWTKAPQSRADAAKKILKYAGDKLKDPVLVSAALDAIYAGGVISTNVEKRLRAAGYPPQRIADALGVPLWSKSGRQTQTQKNTGAYGNQGNLGRAGHK